MKPTIEEALQKRLPLPWKQSTCDGPPNWKVVRRKPEFFNADIYWQLKKYGMLEDDIRNLFYINNADYATLKRKLGAVPPVDDEQEDKPKKQYKNCFPNAKKPNTEPAPALIAPKDRKKVELEPLPGDDGIHAPTSAELEDVFRPDDEKPVMFVLAPTLRECAEKLVAAIDAREAADKEIAYYTAEIRRLT